MSTGGGGARPSRPTSRNEFGIAIICALTLEADAVEALFDSYWDDEDSEEPFDKALNDPNAYTTGVIGRHNVVLAHMPGMAKINAAVVASNCRISFPNVKLALVVGICGVVPFRPNGEEIVLGDVVISDSVVQYDFGQQLPDHFEPKNTLSNTLGRPNIEIRGLLAKLAGLRPKKQLGIKMAKYLKDLQEQDEDDALKAGYPGKKQDRLFESSEDHPTRDKACERVCDSSKLKSRSRLQGDGDSTQHRIHFGLVASGDTVMKSAAHRDTLAAKDVIAFEMEGAGVWDMIPCIVIKGACDYADSHKNKKWQPYAAATAAACAKALLSHWVPTHVTETNVKSQKSPGPWFLMQFPKNPSFVGRGSILEDLETRLIPSDTRPRVALVGLGGIGKSQIAIAYAYQAHQKYPETSVFWVYGGSREHFHASYTSIAQECQIPGRQDPKADILLLVQQWLERQHRRKWLMIIDNADEEQMFRSQDATPDLEQKGRRHVDSGQQIINIDPLEACDADSLLTSALEDAQTSKVNIASLSARLDYVPLALVQAAAFVQANSIEVGKYLEILAYSDENMIELLSRDFSAVGRDSKMPHAVAATWIISFRQIQERHPIAAELLALMSFLDRQSVTVEFLSHYYKKRWKLLEAGDPEMLPFEEALGTLKAFSFITTKNEGIFNTHRLVQLATQNWIEKQGYLDSVFTSALETVCALYPKCSTFEDEASCAHNLPHAFAVLSYGRKSANQDEWRFTGAHVSHLISLALLEKVGSFFYFREQWEVAEHCFKQVLEASCRILGADHDDSMERMITLIGLHTRQDRLHDAKVLAKQLVSFRSRKYGAAHSLTLFGVHLLATIYRGQNQLSEAERLLKDGWNVLMGMTEPNDLLVIRFESELANVYRRQGHLDKAEPLLKEVLETSIRMMGEANDEVNFIKSNLAVVYSCQDRVDDAKSLLSHQIEVMRRACAMTSPGTHTVMQCLATIYTSHGRGKDAEELLLQVIAIQKLWIGEEHSYTLLTMQALAICWWYLGRKLEAFALMERCLELRQRLFGLTHTDTVTAASYVQEWEHTYKTGSD